MLSIIHVEKIFTSIILTGAYLFSVTLSGWIEAWVAKKMGDDTAERSGLLSLNPLAHLDPFGFLILLYNRQFGWGKDIPVNPYNLGHSYRFLKILFVYLSEIIMYITIAFTSLVIFTYNFIGPMGFSPEFGNQMFLNDVIPLHAFAKIFPHYSSLMLVFGMFLAQLIFFNIIIAAIKLPIKIVRLAFMYNSETGWHYNDRSIMKEMVVLLLILLLFGKAITLLIINMVVSITKLLMISLKIC